MDDPTLCHKREIAKSFRQSPRIHGQPTLKQEYEFARVASEATKYLAVRSCEVHAFFTTRENNKEYDVIRMERIDGYSLAGIMSNPTKYSNWFDFKSLSKDTIIQAIHTAFEAIHAKELVHGDMAERNIMIDKNGAFYTIDYGRAEEISHLLTDQKNVIRQTDKTKCAQAIQSFFYVLKLRNVID